MGALTLHTFSFSLTHTLAQTRLPWQHVIKKPFCVNHKDRPTNNKGTSVFVQSHSPPLPWLFSSLWPLSLFHVPPGAPGREGSLYPTSELQGISFKLPEVQTLQRRRCCCPLPPPESLGQTQSRNVLAFFSVKVSRPAGCLYFIHYHSAAHLPLILTSTYIKDEPLVP